MTSPADKIVLASASPRRRELLERCGVPLTVCPAAVDEQRLPGELPRELVRRLALEKAAAVAELRQEFWVIGADTVVVCDAEVLGKPENEAEARSMLRRLRGRTHSVWGGAALVNRAAAVEVVLAGETLVNFTDIADEQIDQYVATGEPLDKAGAYAIQGRAAQFVASIQGSYTNVVGLDLALVMQALREQAALRIDKGCA